MGVKLLVRALCLCVLAVASRDAFGAQCSYDGENSFLSRVVAMDAPGSAASGPSGGDRGGAAASPILLREKEVVLIFAQGPHPAYTTYILDELDRNCAKAIFFFSGSAAAAHPQLVRETVRRGHTVAAGPWAASGSFSAMTPENAGASIEKSFAAVAKAGGEPAAPFFSAGVGAIPAETTGYLKERGVTVWTAGISSGDKSGATAGQVANGTLTKIRETGKGVVLFHDNSKVTVDALDSILSGLRLSGFKVVQAVPASSFSPKSEIVAEPENARPFDARSQRASSMLLDVAKRRVEASGRRREDTAERRGGERRAARMRQERRIARARLQEARQQREDELRRRRARASEMQQRRRVTRANAD